MHFVNQQLFLNLTVDVTRTSNLDIEGYIVAIPTSANTYEFSQFLEESKKPY